MPEMQKMFDGTTMPVAKHPEDIVVCSDGSECSRHDALVDCRGNYHRDDCALIDANDDIVKEVLDGIFSWVDEYTSSEDYGGSYAYIAFEDGSLVADRVSEWVSANYPDLDDETAEEVVDHICDNIDDIDCDCEYDRNEYAAYRGSGCCLFSLDIGEVEEQIDLSNYPELKALHEQGALDDCIANYNGDLYINSNDYYDKELGRRVSNGYVRGNDYPYIYGYANVGGQWHYVVPADTLNTLVYEILDGKDD